MLHCSGTPRLILPLFVLLAWSTASFAEIRVREVKADKRYVVLNVGPEDGVTSGAILETQLPDGACRLKVYYAKGRQAAATAGECPAYLKLAENQAFLLTSAGAAPSQGSQSAPPNKSRPAEPAGADGKPSYHHFGAHLYYSAASSLSDKYTATGTISGNAMTPIVTDTTYQASGALGLGLRYSFIKRRPKPFPEFALGAMAAVSMDLNRTITSATGSATQGTSQPVSQNTTYTDLKLGVKTLELNALCEYSRFYGFLGPNLSMLNISGADAADSDFDHTGALGLQVGAGARLGKLWGVEVVYRRVNSKVVSLVQDIDATTDQSGLWGLMLRVKAEL